MKTLTWHYGGLVHAGAHDVRDRRGGGAAFRVSAGYYPVEVRLMLDGASKNGPVVVDVKDDGVSLFTASPQLDAGATYRTSKTFIETGRVKVEKDSVLTMDVTSAGSSATALTVELDLEEAKDI